MPKLTDEDYAARRQRVIDGARRAFGKHGYHKCTVKRLEEEIGLSRGAIFNYFPGKWRLFVAVSEDDQRIWGEQITGDITAVIRVLGTDGMPHLRAYFEAIADMSDDPQRQQEWRDRTSPGFDDVLGTVARLQTEGTLRPDLTPEQLMQFLFLISDAIAFHRVMGVEYPPAEIDRISDLALDALRPRT